ncbi:MAG: AAA family ATPase [Tenericutes bacterium]|nr:AAA family ATPase [Mycoplasmatota bacterium]
MDKHIINIFGSSGSGSTTLANEIAKVYNYKFIDVDDYLWKKTDPPFTKRNTNEEACNSIITELSDKLPAVISGSLVGIADELKQHVDLYVYINLDKSIRLKRIKEREERRFGTRVLEGGDLYSQHLSFLEWVSGYEEYPETERSRRQHLLWLDDVETIVLKITDELTIEELLKLVRPFIRG